MKSNVNNMKNLLKKSQNRLSTTLTNVLSKPREQPVAVAASNPNIYGSGSIGLKPRDAPPPVPHSYPYHKIAVLATAEGLLLRPVIDGELTPATSYIRIAWSQDILVEEMQDDDTGLASDWTNAAFIHGVLGTIRLFSTSYVLVITAKTAVGNFLDPSYMIYGVKHVTAIPLVEVAAHKVVIMMATKSSSKSPTKSRTLPRSKTRSPQVKFQALDLSSDSLSTPGERHHRLHSARFSGDNNPDSKHSQKPKAPASPPSSGSSTSTSETETEPGAPFTKTLMQRLSTTSTDIWGRLPKGTRITPNNEDSSRQSLLQVDEELLEHAKAASETRAGTNDVSDASKIDQQSALDTRIIREIVKEFSKGGMYFSYNFDITTSLQQKQEELARVRRKAHHGDAGRTSEDDPIDVLAEPNITLPLWKRVVKQFWWNEWMTQPFIEAGLHSYILPIMQGFIQVSAFHIPREPVLHETGDSAVVQYIVISRRSRDRAGLRYQRRGVDDDANVANFVETEAVMHVEVSNRKQGNREGVHNVFSYIQIRGSIPLFWTQTGAGLKPAPTLSPDRTHQHNIDAIRRHFAKTIPRYGPHIIVNLAEQHGKEGALTKAYREYATELSSKDVRYCEYDFHAETKGLKYENISKLVQRLEKTFDAQGFTWFSANRLMSKQQSVFRVNCIDCLDRTNVVQSAFARHMINKQLAVVALLNVSEAGQTEMDIVFNDVWANNGDAISRVYAGTSALKGDFTRTGKRDFGGMLNDGMNSLARMYSSTFSDWFAQAVIDFMLGYRTLSVFTEFLLKMETTDPSERIRLYRIRTEAIATSVSRVLADGERLLSGWTLLSPAELNTKISGAFEEKVVILTTIAFYVVSYDYNLDKVAKYTRVPLGAITKLTKGAYILSTLEEGSRDVQQNYGFTVHYNSVDETTRVTSYSIRNKASGSDLDPNSPMSDRFPTSGGPPEAEGLLSRALSGSGSEGGQVESFVAFKALPIDPARARRTTGSFEESTDSLPFVKSCKEAVDVITEAIRQACADFGAVGDGFVVEEDIVSLAEAKKTANMYSRMEYGLKRLLWLGN